MKKQTILVALAFVFGAVGAVGISALAQTPTTPSATGPMMVNIGPSGQALMRGTVESVGVDHLMIKSWGGIWRVNISTTTQLITQNKVLTDIVVDDFVGVLGTIKEDGSFAL